MPLVADDVLADVARRSAHELADRGVLSHRTLGAGSALARYRHCGGTGRRVGEVVGAGTSFDQIWQAWHQSDTHAAVLAGRAWRQFGIAAIDLPDDRILVVLLLGNSTLRGVRTEPGWAHVTVHAELISPARAGLPPATDPDAMGRGPDPPRLTLRWEGGSASGSTPAVTVGWDPSPPQLRLDVPYYGRPGWLLLGVADPAEATGDGSARRDYSDRILIAVSAEEPPP